MYKPQTPPNNLFSSNKDSVKEPQIQTIFNYLQKHIATAAVAAYHELKIEHLLECEKMPESNSKERYLKEKAIKDVKTHFENKIKSVEKYNSEFSDAAKKHTNLEPFIDALLDEVSKLITNILKNESN